MPPFLRNIKRGNFIYEKTLPKASKGPKKKLNRETQPRPSPQGQRRPQTEGHLPMVTKGSGLSLEHLGPTLDRGSPYRTRQR